MSERDPGSTEAVLAGCMCPVFDNHSGAGYMGQPGIFVMTDTCPLHGSAASELERLGVVKMEGES